MNEPNIKEVAERIRLLREDCDFTMQEMADATGRSVAEYAAQESGNQDLSFTFLYKCAEKLGVDVIELLTGETPHLRGYSLVRKGEGLSIKRRAGFEYLHKAPRLQGKHVLVLLDDLRRDITVVRQVGVCQIRGENDMGRVSRRYPERVDTLTRREGAPEYQKYAQCYSPCHNINIWYTVYGIV